QPRAEGAGGARRPPGAADVAAAPQLQAASRSGGAGCGGAGSSDEEEEQATREGYALRGPGQLGPRGGACFREGLGSVLQLAIPEMRALERAAQRRSSPGGGEGGA
ncbi:hypothetical protein MNEG_15609, partial [Monoraphidium neglectum]